MIGINPYAFLGQVDCGVEAPGWLTELVSAGLRAACPEASQDALLEDRVRSAYLDTRYTYVFSDPTARAGFLQACDGYGSLDTR